MSQLIYVSAEKARSEEWYKENHFHLPPYTHRDKSSITVEIHWHICQDSIGINIERWWDRAGGTKLGEAPVLVPSPEAMVLHLCISMYHSNYQKAALRGLCDILHTIRFYAEQIDWVWFREAVNQSEITRPVYSLLYLGRKYFDDDQLLSWVEGSVDVKFTTIMERIIFSSEDVPYGMFMQLFGTDTVWKRAKKIFIGRLFPSREEMAKRYFIRSDSPWVYLYYMYRPIDLAVRYGWSAVAGFRTRYF